MTLEDRLRQALSRVEPDGSFADRVLARLDDGAAAAGAAAAASPRAPRRFATGLRMAASVVLLLGLAAFLVHEARVTRTQRLEAAALQARNETAARQLAYALELTSRELENVHRRLQTPLEETGS